MECRDERERFDNGNLSRDIPDCIMRIVLQTNIIETPTDVDGGLGREM